MRSDSLIIGVDASSFLSSKPRGEGKTLLRLYQEISKIKPDWKFIFYGCSEVGTIDIEISIPNSEIKYFNYWGYRVNSWMNIGLPFHAWLDKVDILHCSSTFAPFFSLVPYVLTVHDINPLVSNSNFTKQQKLIFKKKLIRSLDKAQSVISVSQSTKNDIATISKVNLDKISVIHWGCDMPKNILNEHLLKDLQISRPYIMAFGGDVPRKNTDRLLEAFYKFYRDSNNKNVNLVLIGINSENLRSTLVSKCKELDILAHVTLLKYVSEYELSVIYSFADCLLYPSLYEGFGMPLLEAMTYGLPIVTSNLSSIPEVVDNVGIQVDPYNVEQIASALNKMVLDNDKRSPPLAEVIDRAKQFSWHSCAEKVISVFESLDIERSRQ